MVGQSLGAARTETEWWLNGSERFHREPCGNDEIKRVDQEQRIEKSSTLIVQTGPNNSRLPGVRQSPYVVLSSDPGLLSPGVEIVRTTYVSNRSGEI